MFEDDEPMLVRLREVTLALPDADEKVSHGIPAFFTTKVFAYYGGSIKTDHGHHRFDEAVLVLADPSERPALLERDDVCVPPHEGAHGWLDTPGISAQGCSIRSLARRRVFWTLARAGVRAERP